MSLRPSDSDSGGGGRRSSAFGLLHPDVRRWIWRQGWTELRGVQEAAIEPIIEGREDVLISAATAGGKTEAVFLPISSRLVSEAETRGLRVICISPLKALINDQYERLNRFCGHLDIPVHRWHGDVGANRKRALIQQPSGILLITPESLEAVFVLHGSGARRLFSGLAYLVVDELHAFIGSERGRQVQSLLHRVETAIGGTRPRIALSATFGDMKRAADFLRPGRGEAVRIIASRDGRQEIKLQVRGYLGGSPMHGGKQAENELRPGRIGRGEDPTDTGVSEIAAHLFRTLRGSDNLIFTNQRADVEIFSDLLRRTGERKGLPNEFRPHHGSLSKELREEVEDVLKKRGRPTSVVCTSTLEMGIDVGSVVSVAQIGAPPSVAAMRQRLGRSGRNEGDPAILRLYIREAELTSKSHVIDQLRTQLVQTVAMVDLMLEGWYEPPSIEALHLSTLIQQILSMVAQYGGVPPLKAWRTLCGDGPFSGVDPSMFGRLLRCLGDLRVIEQAADGTLLLGEVGEPIVGHYTFFAAFTASDEYRVECDGKKLGSLPVSFALVPGGFLIFAGLRWKIHSVDDRQKVVVVSPAPAGRPPLFAGGAGALVHDRVRSEMYGIYASYSVPAYLNGNARNMLEEARLAFHRLKLDSRRILANGDNTTLFFWTGDRVLNTILVQLQSLGLEVAKEGLVLTVHGSTEKDVWNCLKRLAEAGPPDANALAALAPNKRQEKYDRMLDEELLNADYASKCLDPVGSWEAIAGLTASGGEAGAEMDFGA
ncbi:MAG: DEAD/DEAH box helicase [Deltaproteobacteria bacterium]|nr:DEAD/DEAH box helicase [Deltaproteobacteria bacterium]